MPDRTTAPTPRPGDGSAADVEGASPAGEPGDEPAGGGGPAGTGERLRVAMFGLAAVVLVTAFGFAALVLLPARAPGDGSAEAGFARDMSTHHAQAVEMAMLAVRRSDREDIRQIALDMGLTQQAQIGMMRAWLRMWGLSPTGERMAWMHDGHRAGMPMTMPGMATPGDLTRLRALRGPEFDALFCDLMIRHHEGGLRMVDAVLARDPHDVVRDLAESMRRGQRYEIGALTQMRSAAPG